MLHPDRVYRRTYAVRTMTFYAKPAMLPTGRGETPEFTMLHSRAGEPVQSRIIADRIMIRVHKDHLVVLVRRILIHPI